MLNVIESRQHVRACRLLLSEQEQIRALRFQFEHLAEFFTIVHGALRLLIGNYLRTDPKQVQFSTGPNGKPELLGKRQDLRFNMSHSGKLAVFAFTENVDLGIDIEETKPLPDFELIARTHFSRAELTALLSRDAHVREHAFYLCWTRKEAFIKATGEGLSARLDSFEVNLDPDQPARFLRLPTSTTEPWHLHDLRVDEGYAGALAYPGSRCSIETRIFDAGLWQNFGCE